jgi:hypothetical protein
MPSSMGNNFMSWMIHSPFWKLMGEGMAVITVNGRMTGKKISTPINVVRSENIFTVISSRERTWWRNLRGGAEAELFTAGRSIQVNGEVIELKPDVKIALVEFLKDQPMVMRYLKIQKNQDGTFAEADLDKLVNERVLIKLRQL